MKLYRHYKQKYYKLYGTAKHSETLSDLAYYECLYDNPSGQFWVRPTELFFGTIEHNGKTIPRFEEVTLKLTSTTSVDQAQVNELIPLIKEIFGEWDETWFNSHLRNHTKFLLLKTYLDDKLIGFKLGYEEDQWTFYSWIGGVLPNYRKLGAATALMQAQHEWCQLEGYQKIRTQSQNRFKEMLQLNIKFGFDIIGSHASSSKGGLKIVFEKNLAP